MHLKAIDIREKSLPPRHVDRGISLYNLARVHEEQGKFSKAEPLFRNALDILEQTLPPGNTILGKANERYAEIVRKLDTPLRRRGRKAPGKDGAETSGRRQ